MGLELDLEIQDPLTSRDPTRPDAERSPAFGSIDRLDAAEPDLVVNQARPAQDPRTFSTRGRHALEAEKNAGPLIPSDQPRARPIDGEFESPASPLEAIPRTDADPLIRHRIPLISEDREGTKKPRRSGIPDRRGDTKKVRMNRADAPVVRRGVRRIASRTTRVI
jgi:hypothetical protein